MATFNATSPAHMVELMGRAARASDKTAALRELNEARASLTLAHCVWDAFAVVDDVSARINADFATLAGHMPSEMANVVLDVLGLEHPIYGKQIPPSHDEAMAAGVRLAEEWREVKLKEERRLKREAERARGLDIPDVNDAVSSSDAKELLSKLRKIRAGEKLAPVTGASKHTEIGEEEVRPVASFNAVEKLLGKDKEAKEAEAEAKRKAHEEEMKAMGYDPDEEEEEDESIILEEDEMDFDAKPRAPAVVAYAPASEEEKARIVASSEDAGGW